MDCIELYRSEGLSRNVNLLRLAVAQIDIRKDNKEMVNASKEVLVGLNFNSKFNLFILLCFLD
jgi:hypothetical protein